MIEFVHFIIMTITLLILVLSNAVAHADKPLPDSMPVKAAQDFDYAVLRKQRTAQKLFEKYQKLLNEELKASTKDETDLIDRLEKQYSFRAVDEHGQTYDVVDPDTGKITRKNQPPAVKRR